MRFYKVTLFFILLWLLCSIGVHAQIVQPTGSSTTLIYQQGGYGAEKVLASPLVIPSDNLFPSYRKIGRIGVRLLDSSFIYHNGVSWVRLLDISDSALFAAGYVKYIDTNTFIATKTDLNAYVTLSDSNTLLTDYTTVNYVNNAISNIPTGSVIENPNIWVKYRLYNSPIIPFAPYETLTQYAPEPLLLSDSVIVYSKGDGYKTESSYISLTNGRSFTYVDTFISILPADTAFSYNQVQKVATCLTLNQDSIHVMFTASIFGTSTFNIGYAKISRSSPLATIPKTSIRKEFEINDIKNDFSISNVDYIDVSKIIKDENDTFRIFLDVGYGVTSAVSPDFIWIVQYKTVDFINYIPVLNIVKPSPISCVAFQPSLYTHGSYKYMLYTENVQLSSTSLIGSVLRHKYSTDWENWNELEGVFIEALGYGIQVANAYAGQFLTEDDGLNTTLKMYGDTARLYYSSEYGVSDIALLADVFPGTKDAFVQDKKKFNLITSNGNYMEPNGSSYIGSTNNSSWSIGANNTPMLAINSNSTMSIGSRVLAPSATGYKLYVNDSGNAVRIMLRSTTTGATGGIIEMLNNSFSLINPKNDVMNFATNNTTRMWIANDGKVGIINTPTYSTGGNVALVKNTTTNLIESTTLFDFSATAINTGNLSLTSPETFRFVNGGATITVIPSYAGQIFRLHQEGAGTTTIQMQSGNIDGAATVTLTNAHENMSYIWDGTNAHSLSKN